LLEIEEIHSILAFIFVTYNKNNAIIMSNKDILIQEIEEIPDEKLQEIIDFVRFIKSRQQEEEMGVTLVSEPSLAKDWMKPEEDAAWSDL